MMLQIYAILGLMAAAYVVTTQVMLGNTKAERDKLLEVNGALKIQIKEVVEINDQNAEKLEKIVSLQTAMNSILLREAQKSIQRDKTFKEIRRGVENASTTETCALDPAILSAIERLREQRRSKDNNKDRNRDARPSTHNVPGGPIPPSLPMERTATNPVLPVP